MPFYTTKRGSSGIGLGMNLVYNLVKHKLNGDISLKSQSGEGVEFLLKIPIAESLYAEFTQSEITESVYSLKLGSDLVIVVNKHHLELAISFL